MGLAQEERERDKGVLFGQVAKGQHRRLVLEFRLIRSMASSAADLMKQFFALRDRFGCGRCVNKRAGGHKQMNESIKGFLPFRLGQRRHQIGHGGARLGLLRIGQKLLQISSADPTAHGIENGSLPGSKPKVGGWRAYGKRCS